MIFLAWLIALPLDLAWGLAIGHFAPGIPVWLNLPLSFLFGVSAFLVPFWFLRGRDKAS